MLRVFDVPFSVGLKPEDSSGFVFHKDPKTSVLVCDRLVTPLAPFPVNFKSRKNVHINFKS